MCKRYVSPDQISIEREFDLVRSAWEFPINFNTAPAQAVPVIRVLDDQPDPVLLTWGFGEHDTANLPVEALKLASDSHGLLAQGQRCVIPAMGFYEWRVAANGATCAYFVYCKDQDLFGFAGLWEREHCTILTLPAERILPAERRMPAILTREMRDIWLYGSVTNAAAALVAYPSERLIAYPVGKRVDSLDNNDESLMEPLQSNVD